MTETQEPISDEKVKRPNRVSMARWGRVGKRVNRISIFTQVYMVASHGAHVHHCFSLLKISIPLIKFGLGCFFIVQLQTQVTASKNEKKQNITFLCSAVICIQFKNWYGVYVTVNIWVDRVWERRTEREGEREQKETDKSGYVVKFSKIIKL